MIYDTIQLESKMQRPAFRWSLNILLAVIIFWNAEIGRLIGLTELPLAISVVWLATGFSLAAILLFGYRAWPGIFLGNFCYNFLHLYLHPIGNPLFGGALLLAFLISLGSLLQALLGGWIIRRFSSGTYFATVRDIFVFLIPGGLLSCMVASTIGIFSLYYAGELPRDELLATWVTFWMGDSLGVYIFTPLVVVWSLNKPEVKLREYGWEAVGMVLSYLVLTYLTFVKNIPLTHLILPLSLWATYRYRMHGATLAVFLISITAVIPTSLGIGAFITAKTEQPLIFLVSFLEITVAASLLMAAIINERTVAWYVIRKHNIDLQGAVDLHREEIKEMTSEFYKKEKLASLGVLTSAMARHMQSPLKQIRQSTETCVTCFNNLSRTFQTQKTLLDPNVARECQKQFEILRDSIGKIVDLDAQVDKFIGVIDGELAHTLTAQDEIKVKSINLHTMLNTCLNQVMTANPLSFHDNPYSVVKDFDNKVAMIPALPDDLIHAFNIFLESSLYSMKQKSSQLGDNYSPELELRTKNHDHFVEIVIKDNGMGFPKANEEHFLQSFVDEKPPQDLDKIRLAIAHDIIVYVHRGQIKVDSEEGNYLQLTISLPKFHLKSGKKVISEKAA